MESLEGYPVVAMPPPCLQNRFSGTDLLAQTPLNSRYLKLLHVSSRFFPSVFMNVILQIHVYSRSVPIYKADLEVRCDIMSSRLWALLNRFFSPDSSRLRGTADSASLPTNPRFVFFRGTSSSPKSPPYSEPPVRDLRRFFFVWQFRGGFGQLTGRSFPVSFFFLLRGMCSRRAVWCRHSPVRHKGCSDKQQEGIDLACLLLLEVCLAAAGRKCVWCFCCCRSKTVQTCPILRTISPNPGDAETIRPRFDLPILFFPSFKYPTRLLLTSLHNSWAVGVKRVKRALYTEFPNQPHISRDRGIYFF